MNVYITVARAHHKNIVYIGVNHPLSSIYIYSSECKEPKTRTSHVHFFNTRFSRFSTLEATAHLSQQRNNNFVFFAGTLWERVKSWDAWEPKRRIWRLVSSASQISRHTREFESRKSVGLYEWTPWTKNQGNSSRWFWTISNFAVFSKTQKWRRVSCKIYSSR